MIDIFSGVIFTCKMPDGNLNDILKEVIPRMNDALGGDVHVQINLQGDSIVHDEIINEQLGIHDGDYYLKFSCGSKSNKWPIEMLKDLNKELEELLDCKIRGELYS